MFGFLIGHIKDFATAVQYICDARGTAAVSTDFFKVDVVLSADRSQLSDLLMFITCLDNVSPL